MAKKDNDNFDFETEGQAKEKSSFDLAEFFKNLTKKQKGIILAAVVGIVVVIAIVVACIAISTSNNNGQSGNGGGTNNNIGGSNDSNQDETGEVSAIYIASKPTKTKYYVGDDADYAGLSIGVTGVDIDNDYVAYDTNKEKINITGFDSSAPAVEQVITVEYMGSTCTFVVQIMETPHQSVELESIHLDPLPQTEYRIGDMLNLTGAKIIAVYSDGTTVEVALRLRHIAGFESATTVGDHVLIVGYFDDNGGYAETTFTITMTE